MSFVAKSGEDMEIVIIQFKSCHHPSYSRKRSTLAYSRARNSNSCLARVWNMVPYYEERIRIEYKGLYTMLRRTFGPNKDDGSELYMILHNEELLDHPILLGQWSMVGKVR
jgi:hypothetical protein